MKQEKAKDKIITTNEITALAVVLCGLIAVCGMAVILIAEVEERQMTCYELSYEDIFTDEQVAGNTDFCEKGFYMDKKDMSYQLDTGSGVCIIKRYKEYCIEGVPK